jgi:hypothetical protein
MELLSQKRLNGEDLWGEIVYLRSQTDMLNKPLEWTSVSLGAPLLGYIKGHTFLRTVEIKIYIKR